jgi:hypothetical protein
MKGENMIWIVTIIVGALLIKLGALAVLVTVLSVAFKVSIGLLAALVCSCCGLNIEDRNSGCPRVAILISGGKS